MCYNFLKMMGAKDLKRFYIGLLALVVAGLSVVAWGLIVANGAVPAGDKKGLDLSSPPQMETGSAQEVEILLEAEVATSNPESVLVESPPVPDGQLAVGSNSAPGNDSGKESSPEVDTNFNSNEATLVRSSGDITTAVIWQQPPSSSNTNSQPPASQSSSSNSQSPASQSSSSNSQPPASSQSQQTETSKTAEAETQTSQATAGGACNPTTEVEQSDGSCIARASSNNTNNSDTTNNTQNLPGYLGFSFQSINCVNIAGSSQKNCTVNFSQRNNTPVEVNFSDASRGKFEHFLIVEQSNSTEKQYKANGDAAALVVIKYASGHQEALIAEFTIAQTDIPRRIQFVDEARCQIDTNTGQPHPACSFFRSAATTTITLSS